MEVSSQTPDTDLKHLLIMYISGVQCGPSGRGQPFVDLKLGVAFSIRSV